MDFSELSRLILHWSQLVLSCVLSRKSLVGLGYGVRMTSFAISRRLCFDRYRLVLVGSHLLYTGIEVAPSQATRPPRSIWSRTSSFYST